MLTEATRRRLAEFEGKCWHEDMSEYGKPSGAQLCRWCGAMFTGDHVRNPTYTTWNEACPLLAKIVERGDLSEFLSYTWNVFLKSDECKKYEQLEGYIPDNDEWIQWTHGNYTDPSHTAGLVDQAIVAQVLYIVRDGKKLYWFEDGWRERA